MIRLSYMFDDPYEKLIEDLTVICCRKYGDPFLESVILYFENNDSSQLQAYFENEYSILYEAEEDDEKEREKERKRRSNLFRPVPKADDLARSETAIKNRIKSEAPTSIEQIRQGADYKSGKTTLGRKLSSAMYKNPTGKAIVKGVRTAAYGTDLGRKVVGKYADYKDTTAQWRKNLAGKSAEKAMISNADAGVLGKSRDAERKRDIETGKTGGLHGLNPFSTTNTLKRQETVANTFGDTHTKNAISNMQKMRRDQRTAGRIRQNLRMTEKSFTQKRDQRDFERSIKKSKIPEATVTKAIANIPTVRKRHLSLVKG